METTYSPATEAGAGPVPIIFIPGILGSPLYLPENGKKLWLSANFLKMAERMAIEYPLDVKNNDINNTSSSIQKNNSANGFRIYNTNKR